MSQEVEQIDFEDMSQVKDNKGVNLGGIFERDYSLIEDVEVNVVAKLGNVKMPIGELFALTKGSIVTLDALISQPLTLYVKDNPVAKGHIVSVDDSFGIEVSEIV